MEYQPAGTIFIRWSRWLNRYAFFIAAGVLLILFVVSLNLSQQDSPIMDEQAHIPAAYSYVAYGDMRLNPEHPPLIKDLAGLPLLLLQPNFPITSPAWINGKNEQWSLGEAFLFASGNNPDLIIFWSRLPIVLISLLLGWFIYRWTSELAGRLAGLGALLLYAADPNIIAHSHYVTTDIGIAAAVFLATYFFVRFAKHPTFKNLLIAGAILGLAQLTKFSAVLLWPVYGVMAMVYAITISSPANNSRWIRLKSIGHQVWKYFIKYAGLVVVSGAVIWLVYALNTWRAPADTIRDLANSSLPKQGSSLTALNFINSFTDQPVLKPISEYLIGLFMVQDRIRWGSTFYFLGTVSSHGSRAYFPVVFLIKETVPFLLLLLFTVFIGGQRLAAALARRTTSVTGTLRRSVQQHFAIYTMIAFVAVYVYYSITKNLNIGFRHLFPILPFLCVLTAVTVAGWLRRLLGSTASTTASATNAIRRAFIGASGAIILAWLVVIPIRAYPNYLSYFNESVGGHLQGYRYVTDSNYDWGQDLKRLAVWINKYDACAAIAATNDCLRDKLNLSADALARISAHPPIDQLRIDYFGGANPAYTFGQRFIESHSTDLPTPGWRAISLEYYQESVHKDKLAGVYSYRWLSDIRPIARAGDSILIYYVNPADLKNITD